MFIIAVDLTKLQVSANIDEADIGRIRPGQRATFRVDAYPTDTFEGTVAQVRLQPVVVQNVTTYATIIDAPNSELKLRPGMTATLRVEVSQKTDVLRVPSAALRFRPSADVFAALNQPVPPEALGGGRGGRGGARGGGRGEPNAQGAGGQAGRTEANAPPARPPNSPPSGSAQQGAGVGDGQTSGARPAGGVVAADLVAKVPDSVARGGSWRGVAGAADEDARGPRRRPSRAARAECGHDRRALCTAAPG